MSENSRIKIKMGTVEVECEGSESFIKHELPEIIRSVSELYNESLGSNMPNSGPKDGKQDDPDSEISDGEMNIGTTGSVAAKLKVNSGPELVIAAAARLTFAEKKDKFSRKDLLSSMKSASSYYRTTYSKNLSQYLSRLVKDGALLETAKDVYAIQAKKKESLKNQLD